MPMCWKSPALGMPTTVKKLAKAAITRVSSSRKTRHSRGKLKTRCVPRWASPCCRALKRLNCQPKLQVKKPHSPNDGGTYSYSIASICVAMAFDQVSLKGRALRLLSRREYSRLELEHKLQQYEVAPGELAVALDELQAKGFISEQRVLESVVNRRAA